MMTISVNSAAGAKGNEVNFVTDADGNTVLVGGEGEVLGAPLALGWRQAATRCDIPEHRGTGIHQLMSRKQHTAAVAIYAMKLVFPSWAVLSGTTETAQGEESLITASVEYPSGTYTRVTFSGSATGTMPDNANFISDEVAVTIPQGAKFWIRTWVSNATALVYNGAFKPVTGDGFVASATTTPDLTAGGAVTQATVNMYGPCAILSKHGKRAIGIVGDSVGSGAGDTANNGDVGAIARSIGQCLPYINASVPSDSAAAFASSNTNRVALMAYVSDLICQYGINDIPGTPAATVLTRLGVVHALFPRLRVFQTTIMPRTTSTDSWVTTGNQTVGANEATRLSVNTSIRAVMATTDGTFDIATPVESSWNSGLWALDTAATSVAMTADGVHPLVNAYMKIKSAGVINPAIFF